MSCTEQIGLKSEDAAISRLSAFLGIAMLLLFAIPAKAQSLDATWTDFIAAPDRFDTLSEEARHRRLDQLSAALSADPVAISDEMERSIGGGRALQAFAAAMVAEDRAAALVDGLAAVLHGGDAGHSIADAMNRPQQQDGSVWFPLAKQGGFVAGGIAAALDGRATADQGASALTSWFGGDDKAPEVAQLVAQRFNLALPVPQDDFSGWMLSAFTHSGMGISGPATTWFKNGFDKGNR